MAKKKPKSEAMQLQELAAVENRTRLAVETFTKLMQHPLFQALGLYGLLTVMQKAGIVGVNVANVLKGAAVGYPIGKAIGGTAGAVAAGAVASAVGVASSADSREPKIGRFQIASNMPSGLTPEQRIAGLWQIHRR